MHEKFRCVSKIESMKEATGIFVFGVLNLALAVVLGKPHISGKYFLTASKRLALAVLQVATLN